MEEEILLQERNKSMRGGTARVANSKPNFRRNSRGNSDNTEWKKCYCCDSLNHLIKDCPVAPPPKRSHHSEDKSRRSKKAKSSKSSSRRSKNRRHNQNISSALIWQSHHQFFSHPHQLFCHWLLIHQCPVCQHHHHQPRVPILSGKKYPTDVLLTCVCSSRYGRLVVILKHSNVSLVMCLFYPHPLLQRGGLGRGTPPPLP